MGLLPVRAVGCSPEMEEVGFEGLSGAWRGGGGREASQPHGGAARAEKSE